MKKGIVLPFLLLLTSVVLILGAFFVFDNKPKIAIDKSTAVQTPPQSLEETVTANTYTIGYIQFTYPTGWAVDKYDPKRLVTTRQTNKKPGGDFTPGVASIIISESEKSVIETIDDISGIEKTEKIILNGISATKLIGKSGVAGTVNFISVIFNKNNKTYGLYLSTQDNDLLLTFEKEFDEVLSTIKFLDDISNWKTYTNTKYGFEFKYPQDWNLEQNDRSVIPYIVVSIYDKSRNFSMNFQATKKSGEPLGFRSQIKYEVVLAQEKATAYLFPEGYECYEDQATGKKPEDCSFFHTQLVNGNFKYLVVGDRHTKEGEIDPLYLKILSTFKFTD